MSGATIEKQYFIQQRIMMNRFLLVLGALVAVPVILVLSGEEVDGLVIGLFGGLIALSALIFVVMHRFIKLVVTPDGVHFRSPGIWVSTTWDNIDSIGQQFMTNEGYVEGLVLRQSGLDVNGVVRASSWLSYRSARSLRDYENFLPISNILGKNWRDTSFGEELRRHASHLFEAEQA